MARAFFIILIIGGFVGFMLSGGERAAPSAGIAAAARSGSSEPTRVERSSDGHFYVHAVVNGQLVRFMVDTGATSVALTLEDAERVGEKYSAGEFQVVGRGASGPVRGQNITLDSVDLDGKAVSNVGGVVVEGLDISLLGQSYLSRMQSVQMNSDEMVIR